MTFSWRRVGAIFKKEIRDYRHNRFIVMTMAMLPLIFITLPVIEVITINAAASSSKLGTRIGLALLYMLLIPAFLPSALAGYSVVGEREQGTLEPVLITPISSTEFLLGKALAVLLPTLAISYFMYGTFLGVAELFAHPAVSAAVFERSHVLTQLLFTPLLAGWSIWVGIAISTRASDVRVSQQLGMMASLPPLAIVALMTENVITPSVGLALGLAAALLIIEGLAWRVVASMFDRERLVAGTKA
jgi:ABC-type transport system involved in multi-copper enzyme maturation permease subunit